MFVGQFIFAWSDLQQDYIVFQTMTSKKYSGTLWITGVTQIIWNHVYSNWETRNADLHRIDATICEQAQYAQEQQETEKNLLPTLSGPASRPGCILQQYQQTLQKRIHGLQVKAMAQHLETTDPPKYPGRHRNGHQPQSFHL